jgi:hypothetical protein
VQPRLRRTWIALTAALLALLPLAFLAARDVVDDVFPRCRGSLVEAWPEREDAFDEVDSTFPGEPIPLDRPTPAGHVLSLEADPGRRSTGIGANFRIVRRDCDAGEREPLATCGAISITDVSSPRDDGYVDASDLQLRYDARRRLYLVTNHDRPALTAFRATDEPTRHFQEARVLSPRRVPDLVVLLAFLALAVALGRARLAIAYATRLHRWTEASLLPEGILQSESGATIAIVESNLRRVPTGPALVDPAALGSGAIYREVPIAQRRQIAPGSHARWHQGTVIRLRDAQALAVLSVLASAAAVAARLFAG